MTPRKSPSKSNPTARKDAAPETDPELIARLMSSSASPQAPATFSEAAALDPLIRKSVVAKEYRGVSTRHLCTLIDRKQWPMPDVKATRKGESDYYFRSTAETARADFIKARAREAARAQKAKAELIDSTRGS